MHKNVLFVKENINNFGLSLIYWTVTYYLSMQCVATGEFYLLQHQGKLSNKLQNSVTSSWNCAWQLQPYLIENWKVAVYVYPPPPPKKKKKKKKKSSTLHAANFQNSYPEETALYR